MNKCNLTSGFREQGFTLLEILLAITILAFISLGVVNITENAALTKERTTETNENNLQIETALSRLEWDLSQIYSPLYFSTVMNLNTNPNGQAPNDGGGTIENNPYLQQYYEQLIRRFERNEHFKAVSKEGIPIPRFFAPDKNTFEFFTSSNRRKIQNLKQSHFAWVRYTLSNQEQTEEEEQNPNLPKALKSLVRYFSADDPYGESRINVDDDQNLKGAVLLRNVENLEFQYWDYQKRRWETSLRSIRDGESLIRGVKIILSWYDSFGNKRTTTRIFRTHWPMVAPQDTNFQNNRQLDPNDPGISDEF